MAELSAKVVAFPPSSAVFLAQMVTLFATMITLPFKLIALLAKSVVSFARLLAFSATLDSVYYPLNLDCKQLH